VRIVKKVLLLSLLIQLIGVPGYSEPVIHKPSSVRKAPIRLGLLPYLSLKALMRTYHPLVNFLEDRLKRHVIVVTARNFETYIRRTAEYRYDICLTAPHFAALAEQRFHYRRLARYARELDGVIVVRKDSPYRRIEDLRGRVFATPDRLAIITILGESVLKAHHLVPHRDITVRYTPSHNNALISVAEGTADAAISEAATYDKIGIRTKEKLRILSRTRKIPHVMFMAGPGLSNQDYRLLKKALLDYSAEGAGRSFFRETGYGDMIPISDQDMERLAPLLPLLEERIRR